jgi:hypothetical protein
VTTWKTDETRECNKWIALKYVSFTSREENRLRVFKNRLLRRIFGAKKEQVTLGRGTPHNKGHRNLYSSPNFIRMNKKGK